jgi:hypothetical protein
MLPRCRPACVGLGRLGFTRREIAPDLCFPSGHSGLAARVRSAVEPDLSRGEGPNPMRPSRFMWPVRPQEHTRTIAVAIWPAFLWA